MAQHFHTLLSAPSYYHQKEEQLIPQHISRKHFTTQMQRYSLQK